MPLTVAELTKIENMIKKSQEHILRMAFIKFGIDYDNPLRMQKHFQTLSELNKKLSDTDMLADLHWLSEFRDQWKTIKFRITLTIATFATGGVVAILLLGIKAWLKAEAG